MLQENPRIVMPAGSYNSQIVSPAQFMDCLTCTIDGTETEWGIHTPKPAQSIVQTQEVVI